MKNDLMKQYQSNTIKACNWNDIYSFYENLIKNYGFELTPLLELVDYIQKGQKKEKLFAYISLHKLIIGISNPLVVNKESLHIDYDIVNQTWSFVYYPKNKESEEVNSCIKELGIHQFEEIIYNKGW